MLIRAALAALALTLAATAAAAHPHVWVTSKTEVVYGWLGRITALKHTWTFDEGFSSYAVQGLEADKSGRYAREDLQPLAEVNVTSLGEYGFFTVLRAQNKRINFEEPKEYWLDYKDGRLELHITLPLKTPIEAGADSIDIEIYDPTFFVAFSLDKDAPVTLAGARSGCKADVQRPADEAETRTASLSESFFKTLNASSSFGAKFANRITINCQ